MNNHKRDTKHVILRVLLYLFVILIVLVTLYPYFVMFTTAAKSRAEIYSTDGTLLPIHWLWQNFKDIWTLAPLSRYFINSLIVAGGSTLIAIVCGIPAAYALARMKFKGKKIFLGIVIISQMFAPVVLLVGIYKIMSTFGMTDSLVGLVFINAAFNQAFAIWLLRGTFISISPEMEQAATVDGCGKVSALIRILLPVAAPGIVTALIFVFINAWNEYLYSMILMSSSDKTTISVAVKTLEGADILNWGSLMAACAIVVVPSIIFFCFIQNKMAGGLSDGAVK